MRFLSIIIASFVVGLAGCCSYNSAEHSSEHVLVVAAQPSHPIVPAIAFNQLLGGKQKHIGQTRSRVFSISGGLSDVRSVSSLPIVAATEQDGWFFYATGTATDAATHQPVSFISGYAVERGGRQIIGWSVW